MPPVMFSICNPLFRFREAFQPSSFSFETSYHQFFFFGHGEKYIPSWDLSNFIFGRTPAMLDRVQKPLLRFSLRLSGVLGFDAVRCADTVAALGLRNFYRHTK